MRRFIVGVCFPLCLLVSGCGNSGQTRELLIEETLIEEEMDEYSEGDREEVPEAEKIYVHVCGAVMNPGVYVLAGDVRGHMAVEAAGGFLPDADPNAVNLAKPLADGQMLYIPTMEESELSREEARKDALGIVNINKADAAKLMELPGIGQARAEEILRYRQIHGEFNAPEDLKKVEGIKDSVYEKIKDKITIE